MSTENPAPTLLDLSERLIGGHKMLDRTLVLALDGFSMRLHSNSDALLDRLSRYFAHIVTDATQADVDVLMVECDIPNLGLTFTDWAREPGKQGRKDAYYDLPGARVVQKVRTGMTFLQSETLRIAAGPCVKYDNQIVNFINSQYMTWLQQNDWLNCHAAALEFQGKALAMAGFSGGGKSTLMLHMLEREDTAFITNDRLFIREQQGDILATGIPKLPRINPGTILHNSRLHPLIPPQERAELAKLPSEQLWKLEQKYDADIATLYGEGRIVTGAPPLTAFMVLNWIPGGDAPLTVERVSLSERTDLLGAIMKSPGPFYQQTDGQFQSDTQAFDSAAYLRWLERVPVYEASGGVDFDALSRRYFELVE